MQVDRARIKFHTTKLVLKKLQVDIAYIEAHQDVILPSIVQIFQARAKTITAQKIQIKLREREVGIALETYRIWRDNAKAMAEVVSIERLEAEAKSRTHG